MSQIPSAGQLRYIDISQFERLNGTVDIFPAVARVFAGLLPAWLEEVQLSVDNADVAQLRDKLHKMKGCCGMMGAYSLSQDIASLENHIDRSGLLDSLSDLGELVRKIKEMDAEVALLAAR